MSSVPLDQDNGLNTVLSSLLLLTTVFVHLSSPVPPSCLSASGLRLPALAMLRSVTATNVTRQFTLGIHDLCVVHTVPGSTRYQRHVDGGSCDNQTRTSRVSTCSLTSTVQSTPPFQSSTKVPSRAVKFLARAFFWYYIHRSSLGILSASPTCTRVYPAFMESRL